MEMTDLLSRDAVAADVRVSGKKQALRYMADLAKQAFELDAGVVYDALLERERLGSTGVGGGVALPHAQIEGPARIVGAFARLADPIAFEAVDDAPVDLVFLLIAPPNAGADHLKALARVSRLFRRQDMREKLRAATSADALYAVVRESESGAA